jgi:hypothetical protein
VAAGKTADLLLLDANPLEGIRNTQRINAVIFNGNLYDRPALDPVSAHVQRGARSWSLARKFCGVLSRIQSRIDPYSRRLKRNAEMTSR